MAVSCLYPAFALFILPLLPVTGQVNDIFGLFAPVVPSSSRSRGFFQPSRPQFRSSNFGRPNPFQTTNPASNEGIKIVNYAFQNCTSALWTRHYFWVEKFDFFPRIPTFPGQMFVNLTVWVNRDLPTDIDAVFNISAARFTNNPFESPFEKVLCHGYDVNTGCDGAGSCRYCDVINTYCTKYLPQGDCPPRRGRYSVTFNQQITTKDLPSTFIGKLRTTKYWITVRLERRKTREEIACGRVVLDVCKFRLWDSSKTCIR